MATASTPMATSKKKMASPLTDISDHLLDEIFLRLPTPQDLARASAACTTFRRISTDRSFLRCFRSLHAPPLLGFLDRDGFNPALPPHPSAPAAHALAVADFTFSFLPSRRRWDVQDIRNGRVLLSPGPKKGEEPLNFTELVVCDPLHWRYLLLPPVPDYLAASLDSMVRRPRCLPLLVPLSKEEAAVE
ncbi:uncharacterized protein [Triticum aestivum]|uniref:uncharacterized protein n=1 Tax=Triticum aestivum TaxID=4565 RepID=UPI001D002A9A|nr:uncharacterized protein LOC123162691 [Triticum aestivum]